MENVKKIPYITVNHCDTKFNISDIYDRLLINVLLWWFKWTEIKITFGISPLLEKGSMTTIAKL